MNFYFLNNFVHGEILDENPHINLNAMQCKLSSYQKNSQKLKKKKKKTLAEEADMVEAMQLASRHIYMLIIYCTWFP